MSPMFERRPRAGLQKIERGRGALEEELRERHIERLSDGRCQVDNGLVFLDAVSNLERISDHALNIAGYRLFFLCFAPPAGQTRTSPRSW